MKNKKIITDRNLTLKLVRENGYALRFAGKELRTKFNQVIQKLVNILKYNLN